MSDIQQRLEQYRLVKRRRAKFEGIKSKIKSFLKLSTHSDMEEKPEPGNHIVDLKGRYASNQKRVPDENQDENSSNDELIFCTDDEQDETNVEPVANNNAVSSTESKWFKYVLWLVYSMFWCTLFIIAIELQFGIVFLMFSALFGIYFNTRTGPKKSKEISAYSVFNKNCKSIDGTLKAEQFEREIRFGAGSVR